MLTRAMFGVAIVLASVSGSLAAPHAQASADTTTIYNPSGAHVGSAPTVWGWPYNPSRR